MRSTWSWCVLVLTACGSVAPSTGGDAGESPDASVLEVDAGADAGLDSGVSPSDAGLSPDGGRAPECTVTADEVTCPKSTLSLAAAAGLPRDVHFHLPSGAPPANGWPVMIVFQGSAAPSAVAFGARRDAVFGLYFQALTVAKLLDAGYAVLAPEAHLGGTTYWDTNVLPWAYAWDGSPDDVFVKAIFTAITDGRFGALNANRWFAMGASSGGYMSSRMAVSYPGRFVGLVVQSGGYATCGPICSVPAMPAGHPPTLFLHGEQDPLAPPDAMREYHSALVDAGVETRMVVDPMSGHEWLPVSPDEILSWVTTH